MHEHACRKVSEIRHNGSAHQSLKVGPYQGQKWLFWAMDGSPTMDVLTHHGYQMNSKRQNKVTQSVLGPCTPWEEMHTFLFMEQFMVFLESYFYDSKSINHS